MRNQFPTLTLAAAFFLSGSGHALAQADGSPNAEPPPSLPGPQGEAVAPRVVHLAPVQTPTGEALEVVARVSSGWRANLELRFRPLGQASWSRVPFERRSGEDYAAIIAAEDVSAPGLEYFIVSSRERAEGETNHFASADDPHPVAVLEDDSVALTRRELGRYNDRRAQLRVSSEYVDFGKRRFEFADGDSVLVPDRYYRLDADFTYRLFRFPLRAFRLGFTQMLGKTPVRDAACLPGNTCVESAGFRAGGWAELRWRLSPIVDLDTRVLIQATPDGFGIGGRGELRIGDETATHFSIGSEAIAEVGSSFFVRLGWNTVPRFPMAATVELTDYPSSRRDHGVRLVYDVATELGLGIRMGVRGGYQARDQNIGGVSAGLNATVDF